MKIRIPRLDILNAITTVCAIASIDKTHPVLNNVLFEIVGTDLMLTGSDSSKQLTAKVPLDVTGIQFTEGQPFVVDAKKLNNIIKAAPEDVVLTFECKEGFLHVRYGRSRFKMVALLQEKETAFPVMQCNDIRSGFFVAPAELKTQFLACGYAMGINDVRHYLNGLFIELDGGTVSYVASNGHVLARSRKEVVSKGEKTGVILANDAVRYLTKLVGLMEDDQIKVLFNHVTLKVQSESFSFVANLVDGKYPDVEKVIPETLGKQAVFDADSLTAAIKRASSIGADSMVMSFDKGTAKLCCGGKEDDESVDELDVEYTSEPLTVRIASKYLSGTLASLEGKAEKIAFCLEDPLKPLVIKNAEVETSSRTHIVMPMR